jgi:macrolide-specific efflux system membrane fusion protein
MARIKANELDTARLRLQLHQIQAPIAGVVVEVKRRQGEWVEPGMPLLRILLMDRLRVEAFCNAAELSNVKVGKPIKLRVGRDGGATEYPGSIMFVSPEVNPVNGQVRIWAEVKNEGGHLRPGMNGSLLIAASESASTGEESQQP